MKSKRFEDLVPVYSVEGGEIAAEPLKDFLEAQGIPAMISQDSAGAIYGFTVGNLGMAMILVDPENEAKARELLKEVDKGEYAQEKLTDCPIGCELLGPQSEPIDDPELNARKKVLVICTANSARSQIAEAVINTDCWDSWVAFSAGTDPAANVNPYALRVLEEAAIFHQGYPKSLELFKEIPLDLVITVCDRANESCPIWLGATKHIHVGFLDPAKTEGTDEEKLNAFRECLRNIRATIPALLKAQTDKS
ncbi:MAG: DUF2007 domain-containing protein [Anaerolineaceae bacterium]|nr:DUF2007 domain-containing protein [Anaerolineaceae bacterium]